MVATPSVLAADGLGVRVAGPGQGTWILRDASIEARHGRVLALVGPNGSGKSTLIRALLGVLAPSAGTVQLGGVPVGEVEPRRLAREVSFVPQQSRTAFGFFVEEFVAMGRFAHATGGFAIGGEAQERRDREHAIVERALRRAHVTHLRGRLVTTLSGGERARVLLARCLATAAHTVLLDEPTASLDPAHALDVATLCRALADEDGAAVVIAIHDLSLAARMADDVAMLSRGQIVAQGTVADVLTPGRIADVYGVEVEAITTARGATGFVYYPSASRRD